MILFAGTFLFRCFMIAILYLSYNAQPVEIVYNPNPSTGRTHDMILNFKTEGRNKYFDTILPLDISDYELIVFKPNGMNRFLIAENPKTLRRLDRIYETSPLSRSYFDDDRV